MTIEEEKRFAILASVLDLGGIGTKGGVLDNIVEKPYVRLCDHELDIMDSRNEPYWRNDYAFVRKHLVEDGYLDGVIHNNWEITPMGREYFKSLCAKARTASGLQRLRPTAVRRASQEDST